MTFYMFILCSLDQEKIMLCTSILMESLVLISKVRGSAIICD